MFPILGHHTVRVQWMLNNLIRKSSVIKWHINPAVVYIAHPASDNSSS